MTGQICVLCAFYHKQAETHLPDRTRTCDTGRRRLERDRLTVRSLYLRLVEQQPEAPGARDAASQALPMAPTPTPSKAPRVSGSRERSIPINVDVADLTAPAQTGAVVDTHGDQTGQLSVATVLHEWITVWHAAFFPTETAPQPTALALLDWLGGIRLDILCEVEPAIADFAEELADLRGALRRAVGDVVPRPEVAWGIPCPRCSTVSTLTLDLEDPDRWRECAQCHRLLSETEFKDWLKELVDLYREQQRVARGQ